MSRRDTLKVPPEDSVAIRVVVALAVEVGVLAVVLQGAVDAASAIAALALAPAGYWLSYRRRHSSAVLVKVLLSVALMIVLARFLQSVRGVLSVDQARVPLASLFLWVQVLHAFDVPRRRDLAFSMVSSTTLIAVAGAMSLTLSYFPLLLAWAGLAAGWLWLSARPRADEVAVPLHVRRTSGRRRSAFAPVRSAVVVGIATIVLASAVFVSLPRLPAQLVRTPPFSLGGSEPSPAEGGGDSVANPGLPAAGADGVVDFATSGYPGFDDAMDLRARGTLSEEVVFRVRAEQAALWRAQVFDTFDGLVWTASDREQRPVVADPWDPTVQRPPRPDLSSRFIPTRRLTQTFYLATDQPNVLFGASRMDEIYFPSAGLRSDRYGSIRAPILLDEGLVYSVVSEVPIISEPLIAALRDPAITGDPAAADEQLARYLQLPEDTAPRVVQLAEEITRGSATPYERAAAVQSWLRDHTSYDLTVPREPEGVDAVEHFLFETRRGFCEHIASAMVVLLRASGVPARIATGFGAGDRNPLTGYFEVKQSDAHAWVEVLVPQFGWMTFDPTFGVPATDESWTSRLMIGDALAALGRVIGGAVPEPVKRAAGSVGRGLMAAAGFATEVWPATIVVIVASIVLIWSRRRRRARGPGPPDELGVAFESLVDALGAAGHPRAPSATPSELLEQVRGDPEISVELREHAEVVIRTFERGRFAPPSTRPSDADVARARASGDRAKDLVRRS